MSSGVLLAILTHSLLYTRPLKLLSGVPPAAPSGLALASFTTLHLVLKWNETLPHHSFVGNTRNTSKKFLGSNLVADWTLYVSSPCAYVGFLGGFFGGFLPQSKGWYRKRIDGCFSSLTVVMKSAQVDIHAHKLQDFFFLCFKWSALAIYRVSQGS